MPKKEIAIMVEKKIVFWYHALFAVLTTSGKVGEVADEYYHMYNYI